MTKQINPFQAKAGMTVIKSVRKDADLTIINKNNSFSTCKSRKAHSLFEDSNRSIAQNMSDVLRSSLKSKDK